jgi:four helix bundle protein
LYRAAKTQPLGKDFAFLNQMRRAALSVGSNIAEGFERGTRRQHIEACFTAKGSAGEFRSQVHSAHDVELIDDECYAWFLEHCEKCSGQLANYIDYLCRTNKETPGLKHALLKGRD